MMAGPLLPFTDFPSANSDSIVIESVAGVPRADGHRPVPRRTTKGSRRTASTNCSTSQGTSACVSPGRAPGRALQNSRWRVSKTFCRIRQYADLKEGDDIRFLVDRMREYYNEFRSVDIDGYWHRKSGQIVLAVLLLRYRGELRVTRGINSELSLPSGSTCAERSAISTALSSYLGVSRGDFIALAVLAPATEPPNPINPCGVCDEWIKKLEEVSPTFTVVTFMSTKMDLFLERCPVTFVEETMDDVPLHLRANWSCRCGFHLNSAKVADCSCCKQPRFKFKQHLQQQRWKILEAIKAFNRYEIGGTQLTGTLPRQMTVESSTDEMATDGAPRLSRPHLQTSPPVPVLCTREHIRSKPGKGSIPCVVQHLALMSCLGVDTANKTIRDLHSLKFIEKIKHSTGDQGCDCSTYAVTQLGDDFHAATGAPSDT
eukprot:Gregarina_sp_Poly_1__5194@NODE_2752_length_1757_cov_354_554438_g414_i3_p1_GENE_NODE_2752_length_1757_cov_354_554438_g414_i3NODE_2752_length_1757_cov_354_554438_g414_i3_p1_ORF_typecomplete_len464_score50_37LmjF365940deam/PF14421_6/1_1e33_NODE_2752_length_1757_cov_354_554438_g414_i31031392